MGKMSIDDIRARVFELSAEERADLARDLLISLDGHADPDVTEVWNQEIRKRLDDFESGRVTAVDSDEAMRRVRKRLSEMG